VLVRKVRLAQEMCLRYPVRAVLRLSRPREHRPAVKLRHMSSHLGPLLSRRHRALLHRRHHGPRLLLRRRMLKRPAPRRHP
jgi:hypothetical protein